MYRNLSKYRKSRCLGMLRSCLSLTGAFWLTVGCPQGLGGGSSKEKQASDSRPIKAQSPIYQVLRFLFLLNHSGMERQRVPFAAVFSLTPLLYEGWSNRRYRVHSIESASRKKYYRTRVLSKPFNFSQ